MFFYSFDVDENEVLLVVKKMKNKLSTVYDDIPLKVLKRHLSDRIKPYCEILGQVL